MGTFQKPTYKKKKPKKTVKKNAMAIARIESRREKKENYTFRSLASAIVGDSFFGLNSLLIGNDEQRRIGSEIICNYLEIRFHGQLVNADITNVGQMRVMLLVNHQNNNLSTKPPIEDILQNVATNSQKFVSVYNNDFVGKDKQYTILRDRRWFLQVQNGVTSIEFVWRVPLRYKVRYEGNAGDSGDIINHDILLYVNSLNALMSYSYTSILKFTET